MRREIKSVGRKEQEREREWGQIWEKEGGVRGGKRTSDMESEAKGAKEEVRE